MKDLFVLIGSVCALCACVWFSPEEWVVVIARALSAGIAVAAIFWGFVAWAGGQE